jgi:hypothetical protein
VATTVVEKGAPAPKAHYQAVVRSLKNGRLTPILGAGASLVARAAGAPDEWIGRYPPTATELAKYLAGYCEYPEDEPQELLQVAQYASALGGGVGSLYDELHPLFDADYPNSPLHDFLAEIPAALRAKGALRSWPVIATTNYDDLVERTLAARGQEFDIVAYVAEGPNGGRFAHKPPDGDFRAIENPDEAIDIDPDVRTVVLKLHGFVDRSPAQEDSYVITEDHYIRYLTHTELDRLLPDKLLARLRNCHLLFLGYSLRDWNLRAILARLYAERLMQRDWWAVQLAPSVLERASWELRNVKIYDQPLDDYVATLRRHIERELEG